jgi:hypothetical protein
MPVQAQNPTLSNDFDKIMGWLAGQTAQSLGFNAGSTFDPPNEMRKWRIQPDVSFGIGVMPFDKSIFPRMDVQALEDQEPGALLPNDVKFPNLTLHMRLGLPQRMDLGLRGVNMTVPKGYKLSENTTGSGQSNTIGVSLRKHFLGGTAPLVSLSMFYNHVTGYFSFANQFTDLELTPGFFASSKNNGQLEWDVRSIGLNMVLSQVWGKWTPFLGMGYNRVSGNVTGRMTANWATPLIQPSVGQATASPEPDNTRLILGFQRDGSLMHFFMNGEFKVSGFQSGKAFVISTGLAAPFNIGRNSSVVRYGRNKPSDLAMHEEESIKRRVQRSQKKRRVRFWPERKKRKRKPTIEASSYEEKSELIFLR